MKKYFVALLIALFMVTISSAKAVEKPEVTDHEKVKIHLFYASWCPHCHDLIEYFSDIYLDYADYFEFVTYQVDIDGYQTYNQKNSQIMDAVETIINAGITDTTKQLTGGIPLIVIGDSYYLAGFGSDGTEIIEAALKEYQNENYTDLVSNIINDNDLESDAKDFASACQVASIKCEGVESNKKVSDAVIMGIIFGVIILGFGGLVYYSRKK